MRHPIGFLQPDLNALLSGVERNITEYKMANVDNCPGESIKSRPQVDTGGCYS